MVIINVMMMISLMTLYNMGGGEYGNTSAVVSCTLLHTEYASIGIYTDHHIYSLSYMLILPAMYRLYDYCILGCPKK
jgi:hypothetical protein